MNKTRNFKKIVSAVLVLMMVMTTFVIVPMTANAAEAWDGSADTEWSVNYAGTKQDPYQIADAADLAGWSQLAAQDRNQFNGKYFVITNDIDLGGHAFTPIYIGTADGNGFYQNGAINVDGQNHTIYNMTTTYGLFYCIGDGSTIANLHFVGATASEPSGNVSCVGVLVGQSSFVGCTLSNISVDSTSSVTGAIAGGIMGAILKSPNGTDDADNAVTSTMEYLVNEATVTTPKNNRVGGIIGSIQTHYNIKVSYCVNKGKISTAGFSSIGGIVGTCMDGGTDAYKLFLTLENCVNLGEINQTYTGNFPNSSGMVGDFVYGPGSTLNLQSCYDYATHTYVSSNAFPLAIGAGARKATDYSVNVKLDYCYAAPKTTWLGTWTTTPAHRCDYYAAQQTMSGAQTKVELVSVQDHIKGTNALRDQTTFTTSGDDTAVRESYMVRSLSTAITVADGSSSTMAAELLRIERAIAAKAEDQVFVDANAGTEADPYQISDLADLQLWSMLSRALDGRFSGKYFVLTTDIDMKGDEFAPILCGTPDGTFTVTGAVHFDGQNHTISNLKSTQSFALYGFSNSSWRGFFGTLGDGSTVQNVHFVGANVVGTGNSPAGVVVGQASLGNCTFYNISVDSTSTVNSGNIVGGIIGGSICTANDDADDTVSVTFTYVTNAAAVTATGGRVGGIVGSYQTPYNASFSYCVNTGNLTGSGGAYMGGMIGTCMENGGTTKKQMITVDHCYNNATFTFATDGKFSKSSAVVGDFRYGAGSTLTITNCYDYSAMSAVTDNAFPMAIGAGGASSQSVYVTLENCYAAPSGTWTNGWGGRVNDFDAANTDWTTIDKVALYAYSDHNANNKAETPVTNSYMVKNLDAAITLGNGSESTIAKEMAAIDAMIEAQKFTALSLDITTLGARIGLTDPYGLMLITDLKDTAGKTVALTEAAEVGFYFLVADAGLEMTAAELVANEKVAKEEGFAYNESTTEFASAYSALSAAELDATIYFVAYAVQKGESAKVVYSQVRSASPVTFVEDFMDGYMYGEAGDVGAEKIENAKEVAVYNAMYNYYDAYVKYLDRVKNPQA